MTETPPKKWVFVLGAGASVEVGLPMGSELTAKIQTALDFQLDRTGVSGGDVVLRRALERTAKIYCEWFAASKTIASAMPLAPSIDNFVDVHRDKSDVAHCAKLAICKCILDAEKKSEIYVDPSNIYNTINFSYKPSWHALFFRSLTQYCTSEDLADRLQNIAIVSFNYDRCLEHFLYHAIRTYYKISREQTAEILRNLTVLHPYGKVGDLPFLSNGPTTQYGGEISTDDLIGLSLQIRTFTETTDPNTGDGKAIRETVFNCKRLVFLGFAYHPLNVELLLGKPCSGVSDYSKQIFGTAFGSSESDTTMIAGELFELFKCDRSAVTLRNDLKCSELFSEYSRTLSLS
jgi:hypothetical protein